jgi:hypothetical protein
MDHFSIFGISALTALLVPFSIVFAARYVGYTRRKNLRALLDALPRLASTSAGEYAAYKYELFETPTVRAAPLRFRRLTELLGPLIFVLITALCFFVAALLARNPALLTEVNLLLGGFGAGPEDVQGSYQQATAKFYTLVFAVAYVWAIYALLLKAREYTLTPLHFLEASLEIVTALLLAYIVRPLIPTTEREPLWFTATAIAIGLHRPITSIYYEVLRLPVPHFGELLMSGSRYPPKRSQWSVALSAIDGLDKRAEAALAVQGVRNATSLAAANPVLLFVETEIGLYQAIDWVAQAQLASAVGAARFEDLKAVGCRTVFDLISEEGTGGGPSVESILARGSDGEDFGLSVFDLIRSTKARPDVQRLIHLRANIEAPLARALYVESDSQSAEQLERRVVATITQALAGPTLTRYVGWVQTNLDKSGQLNGTISVSIRFLEQQPDWGARSQISIKDGETADWAGFDLELRVGLDRDSTVKKSILVPTSGNSTEYVLTTRYDYSAKPPIWLQVFQRNRLIQTIRLTEGADGTADSSEHAQTAVATGPEASA